VKAQNTIARPALLAALVLALAAARWGATATEAGGRIEVYVSIEPQAYFAERVGGDLIEVKVLLPAGQSPHTFEPSPRLIAGLARAKLFFRMGMPFEERLAGRLGSLFESLRVVDTRLGIELAALDEDHGHGTPDPHIWLDPALVKVQAATICNALAEFDPRNADRYRENLAAFQRDLDRLNDRIKEILAPCRGRTIYVFHPAFGYFARAYGLKQAAVERGGREPVGRELAELVERMKLDGAGTIFIQPEFTETVARTLESALGCRVVTLNALARDYPGNLEQMARLIAESFRPR